MTDTETLFTIGVSLLIGFLLGLMITKLFVHNK